LDKSHFRGSRKTSQIWQHGISLSIGPKSSASPLEPHWALWAFFWTCLKNIFHIMFRMECSGLKDGDGLISVIWEQISCFMGYSCIYLASFFFFLSELRLGCRRV
jgi:hypothetical protein